MSSKGGSPAQIRRFNLMTGDTVTGHIRLPKSQERYFALARVDTVNGAPPEKARTRIPFDRLTPLYPQERAEIMAGRIALSEARFEMPGSLRRCVIGPETAEEIGF